jgi:hypothetical protein
MDYEDLWEREFGKPHAFAVKFIELLNIALVSFLEAESKGGSLVNKICVDAVRKASALYCR